MSKLKLAVQKSGKLQEGSIKLLKDCGIIIENGIDKLKVNAKNFPLEVFYLRNNDIPQFLEDGVIDAAIIGENTLIEKNKDSEIVVKLGFSKCKLVLAIPKNEIFNDLSWLEGKKIATSYPNSLKNFLEKNNINSDIHEISGSVEIAPGIGMADAICDLVSSGSTLFKNGLKEVETILTSEACLAKNINIDCEIEKTLSLLLFRIKSVLRAKRSKYILMNVPNDKIKQVSNILPVLKSPTILPLAIKGWSSLHSVINEDEFWMMIDQLKEAGAENILIIPIEKMVT